MTEQQPEPPKIETVEGVGQDFLTWARDTIVELQNRVAWLEDDAVNP